MPLGGSWADKVGDFPLGPREIALAELHGVGDLVGPELHLCDEDLAGNEDQWQLCIIGKLLGVHLEVGFVLNATLFQFIKRSGIDVMKIGDNEFMFKFSSKDDKAKALALGQWIIGGQLLLVEDWNPSLSISNSRFHLARIWLALPNLPTAYKQKSYCNC